jgi:hypothetical protein
MNSGLEMSHSWPPASLFAVFSPKLWTVLNRTQLEDPCLTGVYGRLLGTKFEDLSLGETSVRNSKLSSRRDQPAHGKGAHEEPRATVFSR